MTLTEENGGIPFNEEQISEYFNNLPAEKRIGELAKLVYGINKNIKKQIEAVVNIDECQKRHDKISEMKRAELEKDVNRLGTFLRNSSVIIEKAGVVICLIYIAYKAVIG